MTHTIDVPITQKVFLHIKTDRASNLTREDVQRLMNWCDHQTEALWDDMTLQEILNVYRVSAAYDNWEGWLQDDRAAAIEAWNKAIIDPGNMMVPVGAA